ncbi:TPA: hypothetical protein N0F65_003761 [Lagenidium giganteum]|uniref:Uncharacterized protein n=1 Tax=Lagenidium giganteum TaxID=4803 RepID=A0AAV2YJ99_9STRA|nr:TPA: hypothetical protein N0F65_003761 [Lagenidium giganteum]
MNGFFTDNQTKQKAYDKYYNEMAKSDFVQGRKLQALIQKESLDEASADSLANLFAQVMAKNREYDYDQITKKLTKGVFKPVQEQTVDDKTPNTPKKTLKPKAKSKRLPKLKFIPTNTDKQPTTPTQESSKKKPET